MAGAGYKLFNTGDVLTAAQVNTYLQEQAVMRFANAAARTTALSGVLAEGMMSYLDDTNAVEVYNGSAWVSISADQTPLTTKGDLFTYTTTDARLGVGANGETLVADSSQTTGLRWGNNLGFTGGKNLLINGSFQIAQRATSVASISGSGYYTADRWNINFSGSGAVGTWTQSVQNVAGLGNSSKMLCTTAKTPLDAVSLIRFRQEIEGQNLQNIRKGTASAQPLTVSFWVKSNVTGTYTVNMYDRDNNRQISGTYTISVADTWEKKSVTLVADTTGTFDNDSSSSAYLSFILLAGTNYTTGTLQTSWGSYTAANEASSSQANVASAINNYWEIAKVQMEIGSVPTEFQLAAGTLAGELAACQRYYQVLTDGNNQNIVNCAAFNTTEAYGVHRMPVEMRTAPTLSQVTGTNYFRMNGNTSTLDYFNGFNAISDTSTRAVRFDVNANIAVTTGYAYWISTNNAAAVVALSAEL